MLQHWHVMIEGRIIRFIHVYANTLGEALDDALPKHYFENLEKVEVTKAEEN